MDLVGDELPAWHVDAACLYADPDMFFPDMFFPDKGESPKAAKALCERCTVSEECLRLALAEGHADGVWGGLTPRERLRLARQAA